MKTTVKVKTVPFKASVSLEKKLIETYGEANIHHRNGKIIVDATKMFAEDDGTVEDYLSTIYLSAKQLGEKITTIVFMIKLYGNGAYTVFTTGIRNGEYEETGYRITHTVGFMESETFGEVGFTIGTVGDNLEIIIDKV